MEKYLPDDAPQWVVNIANDFAPVLGWGLGFYVLFVILFAGAVLFFIVRQFLAISRRRKAMERRIRGL